MDTNKPLGKVSQSPTIPSAGKGAHPFDVADLYQGPLGNKSNAATTGQALDEKLRQAYFWLTNYAVITPFYDIEYNDGPANEYVFGDSKSLLTLPSAQSYSSFILLPLLNLAARRRCLLVGGPGRGKTASAILMGILAGYSLTEVRRGIQHGQPQMTIADLLGNPLPSDLIKAESMDDIRIAWRQWLGMRVKIIDEYNRIPTRTQSALLTVMADNYAEIMDQVYECPVAAWYLTANDDAGGGTYPVIEALRDRIDIVVRALHFNTRFIGDLLSRIESGAVPEKSVPPEIVFTTEEIDRMNDEIRAVPFPGGLLRRLEYFASQFEFFELAAQQMEYKTKDTVKLAALEIQDLSGEETGKDRTRDLGLQTKNGLSVRAMMTTLFFAKALAYFRGAEAVAFDDLRNIIPFILHDKLTPNPDAPFFEQKGNAVFRADRVGWIRKLFDLSCAEFDQRGLETKDPLRDLTTAFEQGLEGVTKEQAHAEIVKIQRLLEEYSRGRKLHGPIFDDILKLKYLHQRYANYLRWLEWQK